MRKISEEFIVGNTRYLLAMSNLNLFATVSKRVKNFIVINRKTLDIISLNANDVELKGEMRDVNFTLIINPTGNKFQ